MFSVAGILRRSGGPALLSALLVGAVLVTGVAAKNQRPFNGVVYEPFTASACPLPGPTLFCAASSGSGRISRIGNVTSSFLGIVDFTPTQVPGCYAVTSSGTLSAKNGPGKIRNTLAVLDSGALCQTSATAGMVTGRFTITGGTGRFSGATGSGTYVAPTTFNPTYSGGSSAEFYTGTISLPRCDSSQSHSNNTSDDGCGVSTGGSEGHGSGDH